MSTMLYKAPGPHEIHGGHFDYIIVEDAQLDAALADGWFRTTPEAQAAAVAAKEEEQARHEAEAEQAAATALANSAKSLSRPDLEDLATRLGIPFTHRISDRKLKALIEAASQPDSAVSDQAESEVQAQPAEPEQPATDAQPASAEG